MPSGEPVRYLLGHLSRLHARNVDLHGRVRALEKQVAWLASSRDNWREKALERQKRIHRSAVKARIQWKRAEHWKARALREAEARSIDLDLQWFVRRTSAEPEAKR